MHIVIVSCNIPIVILISDEENNMKYNRLESNNTSRQEGAYFMVARNNFFSFYQQLVYRIDDLILDKGKHDQDGYSLSFRDLDENEQGELVALQLEEDDRDTTDCFHEASKFAMNDKITCALLTLLKNDSPDNREDLANLIRENSINQYKAKLQDLINDRCGWVFKGRS